ncbi:MAG: hypothetical protein GYA65_07295, partial [Actinobacteria bacterium]|nr:hypothetical protein [Actinomycetota bacterium]
MSTAVSLAVGTLAFASLGGVDLFGFGGATNHAPPVIATMEPTPDESLVAVDASTTTLPGTVAPPETTIAGRGGVGTPAPTGAGPGSQTSPSATTGAAAVPPAAAPGAVAPATTTP